MKIYRLYVLVRRSRKMIQFAQLFIAFMEMAFSDNGIKFSFLFVFEMWMFDVRYRNCQTLKISFQNVSKIFLQFVSIISNLSSNFRLNQSKGWLTLHPNISNQDIRCRIEGLINPELNEDISQQVFANKVGAHFYFISLQITIHLYIRRQPSWHASDTRTIRCRTLYISHRKHSEGGYFY